MTKKITEDQYKAAYEVVKKYKKQQLLKNFPKVIIDRVIDFDGFQVYDKYTQLSARTFKNEAHIYFKKPGYIFGDWATLSLVTNGCYTNGEYKFPATTDNAFCFFVKEISKCTSLDKDTINKILRSYESFRSKKGKVYGWKNIFSCIETTNGFKIEYPISHMGLGNLTLTKISTNQ